MSACDRHLRRPWLLRELSSHLDRNRHRLGRLLAADDIELAETIGGDRREALIAQTKRWNSDSAARERDRAAAAGLSIICRCDRAFPGTLALAPAPPALLYVAGAPARFEALFMGDSVAVVGSRRPTAYGAVMAAALGRDIGASGMTVISGLAQGIDAEAHLGALASGGPTVAVLGGSADRPYPSRQRSLHARIRSEGAVISETAPGTTTLPWTFVARNRIVAGLAAMTVVVEAGARSGSLITAAEAAAAGRRVGAVPGQATNPVAQGTLQLLAGGASLIRSAQDVLDCVYGTDVRRAPKADLRAGLTIAQRTILDAIAAGHDTPSALARHGIVGAEALVEIGALELEGRISRGRGGRFAVVL